MKFYNNAILLKKILTLAVILILVLKSLISKNSEIFENENQQADNKT